ncbi:MAG: hypothetical protein CXX67_03350 [Thaumarchaeota archaeon]|nr:MAG: hypothetical protein CXX67_03350 [Nitrososphaerota archaeon]HIA09816.1 hypothetical protein [Candidatus Nitrosopelagicus sp.]HIA96899.1 hypothetical protein [Candidatus Nitrosopelagicus sp.]
MALPVKPKTNFLQKKILIGCGIAGIAVILTTLIFFAFPSPTTFNEYSILVDPTKEQQSLFVIARVLIQNTSSQSLTNLAIDYGEGDKDFIGTLKPGQTIILSPPDGNPLQYVTVTADNGIYVFKAYREPVAMPGMMGS